VDVLNRKKEVCGSFVLTFFGSAINLNRKIHVGALETPYKIPLIREIY